MEEKSFLQPIKFETINTIGEWLYIVYDFSAKALISFAVKTDCFN